MRLRSAQVKDRPSGNPLYPTTLIRLIYQVEESARRLWIVDLPWSCATSEVIRIREENEAAAKFLRVFGRELSEERIEKMWNDFNRKYKEENHD